MAVRGSTTASAAPETLFIRPMESVFFDALLIRIRKLEERLARRSVVAMENQISAMISVSPNTPVIPPAALATPPRVPPAKMPRNCALENTPAAVPLAFAGATLVSKKAARPP
jgi:hypothetical protein